MNRSDASLERQRLEALDRYDILDTAPEPQFDDIARLATKICATPIGMVTLIDGERQWFKSRIGLTFAEVPRENAFCNTTITQHDVFMVPDASRDPRAFSGLRRPGAVFHSAMAPAIASWPLNFGYRSW